MNYYIFKEGDSFEPLNKLESFEQAKQGLKEMGFDTVADARAEGYFIGAAYLPVRSCNVYYFDDVEQSATPEGVSIEEVFKLLSDKSKEEVVELFLEIVWFGLDNKTTLELRIQKDSTPEQVREAVRERHLRQAEYISKRTGFSIARQHENLATYGLLHSESEVAMYVDTGVSLLNLLSLLSTRNYGGERPTSVEELVRVSGDCYFNYLEVLPPTYMGGGGFGFVEGQDVVTHFRKIGDQAYAWQDLYLSFTTLKPSKKVGIAEQVLDLLSYWFNPDSDLLRFITTEGKPAMLACNSNFAMFLDASDSELEKAEIIRQIRVLRGKAHN